MNELNNQYVQLTIGNALSTRAGSLVKVKTTSDEITGVLGLFDNDVEGMVFDILTPRDVRAVLFNWGQPVKLYDKPNEDLRWYKHNRKDITKRLKLLEVSS